MKDVKIILVVGARPNFMKIAPVMRELGKYRFIKQVLVHTGQHYDGKMSGDFLHELEIPDPDVNLEVGSASHAAQTARIMERFEKVLLKEYPDLVIVAGDVNSTIACGLAAAKLQIRLAHIEAGLRSFDRTMPEEINRVLTDAICDYLFTSCIQANENLRREGIPGNKIFFVGNVMIDMLIYGLNKIRKEEKSGIKSKEIEDYAVLTLHRPSNVDDKKVFTRIVKALNEIAKDIPIYFPAHPRTFKQIRRFNVKMHKNIIMHDPLGYCDFLRLYLHSKFVLTDSGGFQEETTYLNIPCLTIRENTERPITITDGTNILVGTQTEKIIREARNILSGKVKKKRKLPLWDGSAAKRIVKILIDRLA
jgi:UDP-N-acetylglucosamine 2-epimerase (non-hydrolysing)